MTTSLATQIELDDRGVAWIAGTRVKVAEVVLDKIAYGSSPEEIHFQHPDLPLAQIYAALTYYYENQDRVDEQILRSIALLFGPVTPKAGLSRDPRECPNGPTGHQSAWKGACSVGLAILPGVPSRDGLSRAQRAHQRAPHPLNRVRSLKDSHKAHFHQSGIAEQ